MPYLQLDHRKFPLPDGESTIGAVDGADVRLPGEVGALAAVLSVSPLGRTIRRAQPDAEFSVNGVRVGAEPLPLLHGDRIRIGAHELRFGMDAQAGSTTVVDAGAVAAAIAARAGAPTPPRIATGGRLVSLVDGREYAIPAAGLTVGRSADADIVIHSDDASRSHASIAVDALGYVLHDTSTNGCWVNGERVAGSRRLTTADRLTMAGEEFRFSADVPAEAPSGPVDDVAAVDAVTAADADVLATLEWTGDGPLRGTRFALLADITRIGRDPENDLAIFDAGLGARHATLERRTGGWVLRDAGTETGTFVDGQRVVGEVPIGGPALLRLADVQLAFAARAGEGGLGD